MARHQMRRSTATNDPKLWVSGRRNRALAGRIRAKKWRADARRARAAGKLKRARHLEYKANRLSRAIGRFRAQTERYAGQHKSYQQQREQQRTRAVGSPIFRLWGERSTHAERRQARRSSTAGRLASRRLTLERLTGAKPMRPHEVQRWLAKLPGNGPKSISFSEKTGDTVYHWKLKRTSFKKGRPEGYLMSWMQNPETQEVITQYHGTRVSWARSDHGYNRSTVVLHHRPKLRRDGSCAIPAGTVTTLSREANHDGYRQTALTETLGGASRQRTFVRRRDGSAERYTMKRTAGGAMTEVLSRVTPDRQWKTQVKQYDRRQGLHIFKEDSRGNRNQRWVPLATEKRLFEKLLRAARNPKERNRQYRDGKWSWSKQMPALNGSVGTVSAHGKRGKLGRVESSYVSFLGTRYGSISRDVRRAISKPAAGARPVKSRTYSYAKLGSGAAPKEEQKEKVKVSAADRRRLEQSEALVNRVRKRPIRVLKDDMRGEHNAFAQPTNNTIYGRTQVIKNVDVANIGSRFAKGSKALQVGVILHEGGHEFQEPRIRDPRRRVAHRIQAGNLSAINRQLSATVAGLLSADENRTLERGADRAAGHGLARARRLTGDRSMTPADYIKTLGELNKGQPFSKVWTPTQGYDSLRERSRTTWRAYGAGLRKSKQQNKR